MAYSLADFARFCRTLILDNGKPFELLRFERDMLRPHFDGVTETVIIISKKNGKTTLLAALALYHLRETPDAECVIGASSRDQATILFRQAAALVKRSKLEDVFDVKGGYREIRLRGESRYAGARLRVLAADAATQDGVIPTLALVDELHRHPSADLYGVFRDGLTPREGRMVTISTAGATPDSPLGELRRQAHDLPSFRRIGARNYARSHDGSFVFLEWCLTDAEDVHDMKAVKRANPAPWHTIEALRRRHDSPTMTPSQWARFACGVWTAGEDPWVEPGEWDSLRVDVGGVQAGEDVFLTVSVSKHQAAIAITALRSDEAVAVAGEILHEAPGEVVERRLVELAEIYSVRDIGYDTIFQRSAELLESRGLPMVYEPVRPERLMTASATLYRLIQAQKLAHSGDETLRAHVLAGGTKDSERGWRLVPSEANRLLIALAMCVQRASSVSAEVVFPAWA